MWTNNCLVGHNEHHLEQEFWKVCFWVYVEFKFLNLKVTYISCLGKVFERLTNKIQSFCGFENFLHFQVSVLSFRAKRKDGNDGKLPIWLNVQLFYCSVFFETIGYVFCLKELFQIGFILYTFQRFWCFQHFCRIDLAVQWSYKTYSYIKKCISKHVISKSYKLMLLVHKEVIYPVII